MQPEHAAGADLSAGPVPPQQPTSAAAAVRASDGERDETVRGLQDAFAEGRLSDDEFRERVQVALGARTRAELDLLRHDLPAPSPAGHLAGAAAGAAEGRYAVAIKGSVRRSGRWRVPQRFTTFAYKGGSHIDLRAAELTVPVTTIRAVSYKSDVEIMVPPGVRLVMGGFGVSRDLPEDQEQPSLPTNAPTLLVRGFAYKGRIEIRDRPRHG